MCPVYVHLPADLGCLSHSTPLGDTVKRFPGGVRGGGGGGVMGVLAMCPRGRLTVGDMCGMSFRGGGSL